MSRLSSRVAALGAALTPKGRNFLMYVGNGAARRPPGTAPTASVRLRRDLPRRRQPRRQLIKRRIGTIYYL